MRTLLTAVMCVAVLAACGMQRVEHTDGPVSIYYPASETRDTRDDGVASRWGKPQEDSSTYRSGTLYVENDCLLIARLSTGEGWVPTFPAEDVAWDEENQVLVYGGVRYAMGDTITVMAGADTHGQVPSLECPAGRFSGIHPLGN